MRSAAFALARLLPGFALAALGAFLAADRVQARGADASGPVQVGSVSVRLDSGPATTQAERQLEIDVRRAFAIFPGRSYSPAEIDLALARLTSSGLVAGASGDFEYDADGRIALVITVQPVGAAPAAPQWYDRLRLFDDGRSLVKARVGLKGAAAVSRNQWFGNGATLTEFNPRGQYGGDLGPNGVLDLAPSVGLVGAVPLSDTVDAAYLYASTLYLGTLTVGQDNNRNDTRTTGQWEEAYVGIVDAGVTASGLVWRANLSYGKQPYCIGGGMLLCQIASSGGDRGADFAWPRWAGDNFLKAQLRLNQTLLEAFRFEPNDFPSTKTRLAGVNVDHDSGRGLAMGFTWLTAERGELGYFLPNGRSYEREGLRAWHVRGEWRPPATSGGPIGKLDYARQTHADFDMRATGYAAEAGWQFANLRWTPSVTYRYSSTSGDDPATPRYERWDLLYSGGDIDTWVQGQLMKNIQYNSNVKVHRVLVRVSPDPSWRLTGAVSSYRADTLNNIGGVIPTLAGPDLGRELLCVAEHYASRQIYWRLTFASLWPGSGVTAALPEPVAKPWLVGIVQFNLNY